MRLEGKFVQIPHSLYKDPRLSVYEKAVWPALAMYADEGGYCWPRIETIMADTGIGRTHVRIAINGDARKEIKGLKQHGWLKVTVRRGTFSLYQLFVPETSPRNKSGDVPVALSNEVSRLTSGTSALPANSLKHEKHSVYDASDTWCVTSKLTSALPANSELYPLNYTQKINRGTSSKRTRTKQSQSSDFSASFDSDSGHFVLGAAARKKLLDDFPDIDLDASLKLIEARVLKTNVQIQNVLAYLERCLMTHGCVMRAGQLMTFSDGSTARVKAYSDEELVQREQKKPTGSSPVSKVLEDLAAKWRS